MITIKDVCAVLSRSDVKSVGDLIEKLLMVRPDVDRYQLLHDLGIWDGYRIYQDLRDALKEDSN